MPTFARHLTEAILRSPEDGSGSGDQPAKTEAPDMGKAASALFPEAAKTDAKTVEAKAEPAKTAETKPVDDAAAKEARAKELAAMSPEDRAKAEAADKAKADDEAWRAAIPEDGKYAPKLPDGVELDKALLDSLSADFKEAKLTNGQVQALTEKYIARIKADAEQRDKAWAETTAGWIETAKADKDMGGAKWEQTSRDAQNAMRRFGTAELFQHLNETGSGNHPELIRFAAKVGAAISEDRPSQGGAAATPVQPESLLFPSDVKGA